MTRLAKQKRPEELLQYIAYVTSDTVTKPLWKSECEGFTMQYIAEHTDIPVPRVLRTVKCVRSTWIVMKYIEGETLDDVWPKSSIWQKISIIWTLRRYIRQLHQLVLPSPSTPGPFDNTLKSYNATTVVFR